MNKQLLITYFTTMFAITNPLGNTGIFIGMTSSLSTSQQRKVALQSAFASFVILVLVTLFGKEVLDLFGIQIYAFHMAGGLIILVMGMHMLQSKKESVQCDDMTEKAEHHRHAESTESIAVVPMALPLIAGPGAMTSVIIQASKMPTLSGKLLIIAVNAGLCVIIALFLLFSSYIQRLLGEAGIRVVTKVMGMILVAMAIMMMGDGITGLAVDVLDDLLNDGVVSAIAHAS